MKLILLTKFFRFCFHVNYYLLNSKKNILKSNDFGVMQTVFFAFTCKFGLCLHVQKVVICINKTNWHPLIIPLVASFLHCQNRIFNVKLNYFFDLSPDPLPRCWQHSDLLIHITPARRKITILCPSIIKIISQCLL